MTTYSVHHKARSPREILQRSEETEFVKDGFCWPALLVPYLWLIYRAQWLVLAGYVVVMFAVSWLGPAVSLSEDAIGLIIVAVNLLLGFEANDLRRWTLRRHGYLDVGLVIGKPLAEAERRFFQAMVDRREPEAEPEPAPPAGTGGKPIIIADGTSGPGDMMGLLPTPGART